MRTTRTVLLLSALATLLLGVLAGPVGAQEQLDDDCYPVPEDGCPAEVEGAVLALRAVGPVCEDDVPYLTYDVDAGGAEEGPLTVRFVNPDGDDLVYRDLPLAGRLVWPGAEADPDGAGLNWPGWEFRDGRWVEVDDGFAFTRDDVEVVFEVAPDLAVSTTVPYPPPTAVCADPTQVQGVVLEVDEPGDDEPAAAVLGVTLARTGTELAVLLGVATLLLVGGGTALLVGRRRRDAVPTD